MTDIKTPVDNGVNTDALLGAREALTGAPDAAEFTWTAHCSWVDGTFSQTTVDGFSGLGQEHHHRTAYSFDADHPECFASEDRGATPPEITMADIYKGVVPLIVIQVIVIGAVLLFPIMATDLPTHLLSR